MLAFGEGANSFMYSDINNVIFIIVMFIPETIFNIYRILKNRKENNFIKSKNYIITQTIIFLIFIGYIITEV